MNRFDDSIQIVDVAIKCCEELQGKDQRGDVRALLQQAAAILDLVKRKMVVARCSATVPHVKQMIQCDQLSGHEGDHSVLMGFGGPFTWSNANASKCFCGHDTHTGRQCGAALRVIGSGPLTQAVCCTCMR